jgi:hypothetical protein
MVQYKICLKHRDKQFFYEGAVQQDREFLPGAAAADRPFRHSSVLFRHICSEQQW